MTRLLRSLLYLLALLSLLQPAAAEDVVIQVYKQASCTCCRPWIKYMEANGFKVEAHDITNVLPLKQEHGIPLEHKACHTALVEGYVLEGHVSAEDVRYLLRERPAFKGLIVPGMPKGAPGMEGPDAVPYEVLALDKDGRITVYDTRQPMPPPSP